jgi:hypothetical protein
MGHQAKKLFLGFARALGGLPSVLSLFSWRVATWRGRVALFRALLAPGIVVVDERSRDLCC